MVESSENDDDNDDDDEEEMDDNYSGPIREIDLASFEATDNTGSGGTQVSIEDRRTKTEESKLSEAAALPAVNGTGADIQIDEDLFGGEDLDQLEEDLDILDMED